MAFVPNPNWVNDAPPGFDAAEMIRMQFGIAEASQDAAAAVDVSTQAVAIAEAAEPSVNVRSFGAVADGVTDDTAAIRAAIDSVTPAGGVVRFPQGVYGMGSRVVVPGGVTLQGEGMGVSVLRRLAENADHMVLNRAVQDAGQVLVPDPAAPTLQGFTSGGTLAPGTYSYRVAATNLGGTGETNPSPAKTLAVAGAGTVRIVVSWAAVAGATGYRVYGRTGGSEQLLAELGNVLTWEDNGSVTPRGLPATANTTRARPLGTDYGIQIRDLTLDGDGATTGLQASALYLSGVTNARVERVEAVGAPRHGIEVHYATDSVISGCRACNNGLTGIMFYRGSTDCVISNNVCNDNGNVSGAGIALDHYSKRIVVTGNTCSRNTSDGASASEGAESCVFTGNLCDSNLGAGIVLAEGQTGRVCHSNVITGNVLTRNSRGVRVYGAERSVISGNACYGNTGFQVQVTNGIYLLAQQIKVDGVAVTIPFTA